jgi:hypothetical protein
MALPTVRDWLRYLLDLEARHAPELDLPMAFGRDGEFVHATHGTHAFGWLQGEDRAHCYALASRDSDPFDEGRLQSTPAVNGDVSGYWVHEREQRAAHAARIAESDRERERR